MTISKELDANQEKNEDKQQISESIRENTAPGICFLDIMWHWDIKHYGISQKVTIIKMQ